MIGQSTLPGEIPERRLLGRDATLVERIRVYRRGETLEVDTSSFYRIVRHRVLFEEVELATIHRGRSYLRVFVLAFFGLSAGIFGAVLSDSDGGGFAFWILLSSIGGLAAGFLLPDWVISIQSRRTWTRMRLGVSHGKARRIFDELVAAIRETQTRLAAERPAPTASRSPFASPRAEDFPAPPPSTAPAVDEGVTFPPPPPPPAEPLV